MYINSNRSVFFMQFKARVPHYYVPPCPVCGSKCTGRYLKKPLIDAWYTEEQSLKNAEIVRFVRKEPIKNLFCVDCGYEWGKTINLSWVTREELEQEKKDRGTQEAYEELHTMNQEARKQNRKKPARRVFRFFFG